MVTPSALARRAALFEQLAAMIGAGVTLTSALEMVGRNRTAGIPRKVLAQLTQHLNDGHTFTDAMQMVSGQKLRGSSTRSSREYWLSEFDLALLSAGEESGRMDSSFRVLGRYYAARAKIIRDTISGLLTTAATLHVFLIVFPITLLVGCAKGIMDNNYSQCVPFIMEKVAVFGALYGSIIFLAFACQGNRGENWRLMVESVFGVIPLLRTALKYLALARLACALEALNAAGVSVLRGWEIAGAASGSSSLKRELTNWKSNLESGTTPAEMVAGIRYFPDLFQNLYNTGEQSGKLDETLGRLHTYFEAEGFRLLQHFTRILNGVIYAVVVLFAVRAIFSFYADYFKSANSMLNGF